MLAPIEIGDCTFRDLGIVEMNRGREGMQILFRWTGPIELADGSSYQPEVGIVATVHVQRMPITEIVLEGLAWASSRGGDA